MEKKTKKRIRNWAYVYLLLLSLPPFLADYKEGKGKQRDSQRRSRLHSRKKGRGGKTPPSFVFTSLYLDAADAKKKRGKRILR